MGTVVENMIDAKIILHCTDNGKDVDAHILNYKPKGFLEAAVQTVKIKLVYKENTQVFVGSMMGREFVIKESDLPRDYKEYQR